MVFPPTAAHRRLVANGVALNPYDFAHDLGHKRERPLGITGERMPCYGRDGGRKANDPSVPGVDATFGEGSSRGGKDSAGAPGFARNAASRLMPSRAMRVTTASSAAAQARSDGAPGTSPASRVARSRSAS